VKQDLNKLWLNQYLVVSLAKVTPNYLTFNFFILTLMTRVPAS
jgi:hypothetical protein